MAVPAETGKWKLDRLQDELLLLTVRAKYADVVQLEEVGDRVAVVKDDKLSQERLGAHHFHLASVPGGACHCPADGVCRWQRSRDSADIADIKSVVVPIVRDWVVCQEHHPHLVNIQVV